MIKQTKHYWSYISLGSCSPQDFSKLSNNLMQLWFLDIFFLRSRFSCTQTSLSLSFTLNRMFWFYSKIRISWPEEKKTQTRLTWPFGSVSKIVLESFPSVILGCEFIKTVIMKISKRGYNLNKNLKLSTKWKVWTNLIYLLSLL